VARVVVNFEACMGSGLCVGVAPEIFALDDDGIVSPRTLEVSVEQMDVAEEAVRSCPLGALSLVGD
jgi:ferredoxin